MHGVGLGHKRCYRAGRRLPFTAGERVAEPLKDLDGRNALPVDVAHHARLRCPWWAHPMLLSRGDAATTAELPTRRDGGPRFVKNTAEEARWRRFAPFRLACPEN